MGYVVNFQINDTLILRNDSNVALIGKNSSNFSKVEAYSLVEPNTTANVTLTEIGEGEYRISFTPSTVTTWTAHLVYAADGVFREFSGTYDIIPKNLNIAETATSGSTLTGRSLVYIRREIGKDLGDCTVLNETTGGVSDIVFVDSNRIVGPDHAYRGRTIYVTGGTPNNIGQTRRVDDSNRSSTSITLSNTLNSTIKFGDQAEMWGTHDEGWQPWEVNDTINAVIADGGDHFYIPVSANVTLAFNPDVQTITIPETITKGVYGIFYQNKDDLLWYPIDQKASEPGQPGWWVHRGLGYISIYGARWSVILDGVKLKVHGYGVPPALVLDTDVTDINKEWIVRESIKRLLLMAMQRKPEVVRSKIQGATRDAEIARQRALMRPAPDWQRV